MFIQTEATPDPASLKFLPGREVLTAGRLILRDRAEAASSPLAERLFAIRGVSGVSLDADSITISKTGGDWQHLKPAILGAIMEHFLSDAPILRPKAVAVGLPARTAEPVDHESGALDRIISAMRQVIDPELGYNIVDLGLVYEVVRQEGGVVCITMTTTTPGCPATNYLKKGVSDSVGALPEVEFVDVKLTYEPHWTPEMMSPEAKTHLGVRDGGGR